MRTISSPAVRSQDRVFLQDVLQGLSGSPRTLPCKYFYDERGSALFDQICEVPEYYHTRCEVSILLRHSCEMLALMGEEPILIEYGSGSSLKTRLLLDEMNQGAYVPVDISREHLVRQAEQLACDYPHLEVAHVCADFTRPFGLPRLTRSAGRRVVYFSGSTISNFNPSEAFRLLQQIATVIGSGGGLLIGVDLIKDRTTIESAYNDAQGVTAAFNRNLLDRINQQLGGNFILDYFQHHAFWNEEQSRIEMHLISLVPQTVKIGTRTFDFARGESICTEYSYKFSIKGFADLLSRVGMKVRKVWTDVDGLFSVQYAERA